MANPAVVLLSGGMDSTTLLYYVVHSLHRDPVFTLTFDYQQRHVRELQAAETNATRVGANHHVIKIEFLGDVVRPATSLVQNSSPVPDLAALPSHQLQQPPTYVPNRNMILLAIAAAFAEAHKVKEVYYGAQAADRYGYWDCTAEFLEKINAVLALNRGDAVIINAPFIHKKKSEILKLGLALGVDYSQTWSCYRGELTPCGTCPTCVERLNAFKEIDIPDPLMEKS